MNEPTSSKSSKSKSIDINNLCLTFETQTEKHQRHMMGEINKLTANGGKLNVDDYQRTVDTLLGSDSDPVINKEPVGAWTHKVWDAAFGS